MTDKEFTRAVAIIFIVFLMIAVSAIVGTAAILS